MAHPLVAKATVGRARLNNSLPLSFSSSALEPSTSIEAAIRRPDSRCVAQASHKRLGLAGGDVLLHLPAWRLLTPSLTPLTTCRRELVLLMQIPVRCSCGTCAEWALIEFQVCRRFPRPVLGGRATQRVRPLPATPGRSRAHKRRQLGRPERGKPLRDSSGACSCVWTDASHWRCGLSTACSEWATCSWQRAAVPAAGGD